MDDPLPQEFRIEVERVSGARVAGLFGELDLVNAEDVERALVDLAARGETVVADLSSLEFVDSIGLSALLVARHRIAVCGSRLVLRGADGAVRRVFQASGLDDVLDD